VTVSHKPIAITPLQLAKVSQSAAAFICVAVALKTIAAAPTRTIATAPCSAAARKASTTPRFSARSLAIM